MWTSFETSLQTLAIPTRKPSWSNSAEVSTLRYRMRWPLWLLEDHPTLALSSGTPWPGRSTKTEQPTRPSSRPIVLPPPPPAPWPSQPLAPFQPDRPFLLHFRGMPTVSRPQETRSPWTLMPSEGKGCCHPPAIDAGSQATTAGTAPSLSMSAP